MVSQVIICLTVCSALLCSVALLPGNENGLRLPQFLPSFFLLSFFLFPSLTRTASEAELRR